MALSVELLGRMGYSREQLGLVVGECPLLSAAGRMVLTVDRRSQHMKLSPDAFTRSTKLFPDRS